MTDYAATPTDPDVQVRESALPFYVSCAGSRNHWTPLPKSRFKALPCPAAEQIQHLQWLAEIQDCRVVGFEALGWCGSDQVSHVESPEQGHTRQLLLKPIDLQ